MKGKKSWLYASRFAIIFLSIIAQTVAVSILFLILGRRFAWVQITLTVIGILLFFYIVNKEQPAVYKLPWVIVLLITPIVGVIIYYTFGNVKLSKKQIKMFRRIYDEHHDGYYNQEEVLSRLDECGGKGAGTAKYIRSTTSLPVYSNSTTTYLKTGEEFLKKILEEIEKAEKYIFLEYFIIEDGVMWQELYDLLKEKLLCGVKIYLMYDDIGCITKLDRGFNKQLRKEGIDARVFHKFVPIASVVHNNRDHRKIAVIDGQVGFMSGANIADEYINVKKPFGRWRDNAIMIKGQATDSLVRLFIQLYNMTGGPTLNEDDFIVKDPQIYNDGFVIPFGDAPAPVEVDHITENVYLDMISRADKYLYITTPYLIVDTNIIEALKAAVRRGVDVRVIIPEIPDKKPIYIMTKNSCKLLNDAGVKVYLYRGGFIHSKTFLCDGVMAVVGTANLDFRSLIHHFECATFLIKTSSIKDVYADFIDLFENECKLVQSKELDLNWIEKTQRAIMGIFAPLM